MSNAPVNVASSTLPSRCLRVFDATKTRDPSNRFDDDKSGSLTHGVMSIVISKNAIHSTNLSAEPSTLVAVAANSRNEFLMLQSFQCTTIEFLLALCMSRKKHPRRENTFISDMSMLKRDWTARNAR